MSQKGKIFPEQQLTNSTLNKSHFPRRKSQKGRTYAYKKDVDEALNDTRRADKILALQYKTKWSIRDIEGKKHPLIVTNEEFSESGTGLQLFFDFIKYSAIVFFFMAAISLIPLYMNYTGDGIQKQFGESGYAYTKFSLANQPQLSISLTNNKTDTSSIKTIQNKNDKAVQDFIKEMNVRENYIVIPDIAYSIVFLLFIVFWNYKSKKIKFEAEDINATPGLYSIYVTNIQKDSTENEIRNHFKKFGKIVEVNFVKDYKGTLFEFKQKNSIENKIAVEEFRLSYDRDRSKKYLNALQKQLQKEETKLKNMTSKKLGASLKHSQYESIGVYIVFNEELSKRNCVKFYQKNTSLCGKKDKGVFLKGQQLKVKGDVEEPGNLRWENLDASWLEIAQRKCCIVFLIILIMFFTFSLIFVANAFKPSNQNQCPSSSISYDSVYEKRSDKYLVDCYCRQLSPSEIYGSPSKKELCWDSYLKYLYTMLLSILVAMVIGIVNWGLQLLLTALGKFQKYKTITGETEGTTISLFLAMFINTAVLTLLFQADIGGFKPSVTLTKPVPPLSDQQSKNGVQYSSDFDRQWYLEVAGKITYTMALYIVYPHFLSLLLLPCYRHRRQQKANKAIIQKDMNENILGPEFTVVSYYAIVLNTIFTTLFYCSGIPILLWFAAFSLAIQYWVYKYLILRYNKRPPSYDHRLNEVIIQILPYGLIIHLMIGIYMYGSPLIFPESEDSVKQTVSDTFKTANGATEYIFGQYQQTNEIQFRFQRQVYMSSLLMVVIFGVLFYRLQDDEYVFKPYEEVYDEINHNMLASYDIKVNSKYAKLISAMDAIATNQESQQEIIPEEDENA